ncbi:hypothetical protein BDR26DRAFT_988751 [Obelidium mucronatum]|nr:hypothetical protein BDR26DRAFT_988751 [Obelidium mucronatum]
MHVKSTAACLPLPIVAAFFICLLSVTFLDLHSTSHHIISAATDVDSDELPSLKREAIVETILDLTALLNAGKDLVCPKWEAFDHRVQSAKNFDNNCQLMDAHHSELSVQLCTSKVFCGQGYFLELIRLVELDAYFKKQLGPDSFHVIFDGPERASSSMWKHLGDREYKMSFRLTNTGIFKVQLIHVHHSFLAVNEVMEGWHNPLMKQMLSNQTELVVCPQCSKYKTPREVAGFKSHGYPYIWEPLGCRFDQRFQEHSNSSCHSKNSQFIGIFGDSHTRVLTLGLAARLGGASGNVLKNIKYHHILNKFFSLEDLKANSSSVLGFELLNVEPADLAISEIYKGLTSTEIEYKYYKYINRFIDTGSYRNWNAAKSVSYPSKPH